MRSVRLPLVAAAAAALAAATLAVVPAHAATGDTWSGFKVVDVVPAASTQTDVLGMMPRYHQGDTDLYLWNIVRMVTDANGHESWVYCIERERGGDAAAYTEDPLSASTPQGRANAARINRVLADSTLPDPGALEVTTPDPALANPAVHVLPARRSDHVEVTAVQLALWHFTDGLDFTASNTTLARDYYPDGYTGDAADATIADVLARYDALVAAGEAHPLTNPDPTVTITPAAASADAGRAILFTVTGKDIEGGIALTTGTGERLYAPGDDDACDTSAPITSLPSTGGTVCVVSGEAGAQSFTATGRSAGRTTHMLYAANAQSLIGTAPDVASDTAKATWTAVESTSSPSPTTTPSASSTSTPTVSQASSSGAAVAPASGGGGAAVAPSGALATTGASGLLDRAAAALVVLAVGLLLLVGGRRRAQRTH